MTSLRLQKSCKVCVRCMVMPQQIYFSKYVVQLSRLVLTLPPLLIILLQFVGKLQLHYSGGEPFQPVGVFHLEMKTLPDPLGQISFHNGYNFNTLGNMMAVCFLCSSAIQKNLVSVDNEVRWRHCESWV